MSRPGDTTGGGASPPEDRRAMAFARMVRLGCLDYSAAEFALARPHAGEYYERIDQALDDAAKRLGYAFDVLDARDMADQGRAATWLHRQRQRRGNYPSLKR